MSFFDKVSRTFDNVSTQRSHGNIADSANTVARQSRSEDEQPRRRRQEDLNVVTGWGNTPDESAWDGYKREEQRHTAPLPNRLLDLADNGAFTLADDLIVEPIASLAHRAGDIGENSDVNDAYNEDFRNSGMTQSQIHDIYDRNPTLVDTFLGKNWGEPVETLSPSVDDGVNMDYSSLTSDYMTGSRYIHYRDELGMGGRDGWIDPNGIYSKADEAAQYGFTPFTPDVTTALNGSITSAASAAGHAGTDFGHLREDLVNFVAPFQATIDGESVNGWELRNTASPYIGQLSYLYNYEPESILRPPRRGQYTMFVKEWHVVDQSGAMTVHRGSVWRDERTGALRFSDGSSVIPQQDQDEFDYNWVAVGNEQWGLLDGKRLNCRTDPEDPTTWGAMWLPDLVMSDGTRVNYMQASRFMSDRWAEDGEQDEGIEYNFAPLGLNKPTEYTEMEMFGDNGKYGMLTIPTLNSSSITDIPTSVVDLTAGSAPIMIPGFDWIYSASNAIPAMSGIDPSSYDGRGNYYSRFYASQIDDDGRIQYGVAPDPESDIDETLSNELRLASTAGNFLVPLTEQLVGPVGEGVLNIPARTFTRGALSPRSAAGRFAVGAVEEGLEEIFGNAFEDWTANGLAGWYADPLLDENGEEIYDSAGRRYVDYDTPLYRRIGNYFGDIPGNLNAFLGGASIGGVMTAPTRVRQAAAAGGPFRPIPFEALTPEEQVEEINRIRQERERQEAIDDIVIDPRYERLTGPHRETVDYGRRGDI